MTFRIFTNDRGKRKGVPMYSAVTTISANTQATAERRAAQRFPDFGPPHFAPIKILEWPANSSVSQEWLAKHVNPV